MISLEWVDELIARAEVALLEAQRHHSTVLIDLGTSRLTELRALREQIPGPREPGE